MAMRFLRGPWFILACVAAVGIGVVLGAGWIPKAWMAAEPVRKVVGLGPAAGPIRLTADARQEADKRLQAAFKGKVPDHTTLEAQSGEYALDRSRCETRSDGLVDCPVLSASPFFRSLLAESDPKVEQFFLAAKWLAPPSFAGGMRGAFILGRDGKVKIVVEVAGAVRELVAVKRAAGIATEQDLYLRFRAVAGAPGIYMADDPGDLKRRVDGGFASLVFQDLEQAPLGERQPFRNIADLVITPALEQRHKFFAILKDKPYQEPNPRSEERPRVRVVSFQPRSSIGMGVDDVRALADGVLPGASRAVFSERAAVIWGGDIYAFRIGEERYLGLSHVQADKLAFGVRRAGTVSRIEGVKAGAPRRLGAVVVPFPLRMALRGDEQLVIYHADYGDEEHVVFTELQALFEGL
jgi:hypothetical protein